MKNEKPTILFISENFIPETNAAAARVFERGIYWKDWGYEVKYVTSFPNRHKGKAHIGYSDRLFNNEIIDGLDILRVKTYIPKKNGTFYRALHQLSFMVSSLIAGILTQKTNVIIVTTPQFFCSISGLVISKIKRVPFILEVADIWTNSIKATQETYGFFYSLMEKIETFIYKKSDAIVVLTHGFKKEIIKRGVDKNKIFVVMNGVKQQVYSKKFDNSELIDKFNIKDKKVIGYAGSLGLAQGLLNIVETARILDKENVNNVLFIIMGEGDQKEIIAKAAKGLKNIILVEGKPKDLIPKYLSIFNIGLAHLNDSTAFKTTIPSKIFEMMAAGLPILAVSPKGEASELVEILKIGCWVSAGNPRLLANSIVEMIRDPQDIINFSKNSLIASKEFTREQQSQKILDVVDTVVAKRIMGNTST